MTLVGLFEAKLEALETRMDVKLRALFEEFRLGRSSSPIRSQCGANLDCKKNLSEELAMIRQTSTIQEYQTRFERLSNQTYDWYEKQILRTFIKGLKPEIQEKVKVRQPYTLKATISFARHQEERLNYEARKTRVAPRPATPKLSPPPTVSRPPQPHKFTREDLHDRSTKDLCGCCDKLWSLEHKCKKETPLMIVPTEESKLEDTTLEPKEKDTPQLATHTVPTLASYTNLQTLKIEGFLEQQSVIILIDAESTQTSWVIRLLLPT
ncbi:hypothetical protein BHE74_00056442 [Ensete ventricosum]|nr:hypothetical protein BHE74_00056442 [Ensete ventricosum]